MPQVIATSLLVGLIYPSIFEGMVWHGNLGMQGVQGMVWRGVQGFCRFGRGAYGRRLDGIGRGAVARLASWTLFERRACCGASAVQYSVFGFSAWTLTVGWFGFNVMSAQKIADISGLVAVNSLMAMVGGTLAVGRGQK